MNDMSDLIGIVEQLFEKLNWFSVAEGLIVEILGTIIGAGAILFGYLWNKRKKNSPVIPDEKTIKMQDAIKVLQKQVGVTNNPSKKIQLSAKITQLKQTLKKKNKEIKTLNKSFAQLTTDFAKKANKIANRKGKSAALHYLQNLPKEPEDQLKQTMKKWADKYRLEAQLLIVDNQYDQAKQAYQKMIKYDNGAESLFIYARFLQDQNAFKEAIINYQNSLEIYRTLAKTNPDVYQPDVAMTLNNLAVLYSNQDQNTQAKKAYDEALEIYQTLAKTNPDVYQPDVATTLNNLARLYSNQNQNTQAEKSYDKALEIYRTLAKTNPDVYQPNVATTLNNLAVLYRNQNQNTQAEKAYDEALEIYQTLAKTNLDVYGIDLARALITGVTLFDAPKSNLDDAQRFLEHFEPTAHIERLLEIIEGFR
ncbi:hypothetical protein MNB_SUP05-SYMBIONT-5-542 [hydrothermal vent metagenome]|uniref:Uncharacterized protein n=1 Tax=hydrothermal vent metagenome TaxID=652676 RepID=A0A1W1E648_9ZZZZ